MADGDADDLLGTGGVISIESGVSLFDKKGFCVVRVDGKRVGQLEPEQVRQMALHWLSAADAAESDSAVFRELTETAGMDPAVAGGFVSALRTRRSE